jgi:hypothetical protein
MDGHPEPEPLGAWRAAVVVAQLVGDEADERMQEPGGGDLGGDQEQYAIPGVATTGLRRLDASLREGLVEQLV